MSQLDRAGLISQSNYLFPDNTSQEITPSDIRQFNTDIADSLQLTGSYATTGSNTFNGTQTINGQTILNGIVTLNDNLETYSGNISNYGARIQGVAHGFENGSSPFTGSFSGDGSGLTGIISASHAETADLAILATNSTYSQNTITTGKNLHTTTIQKGTPLFFTASGTSGNLVGILPADAGNPSRMPAGGVAGENITVGAEGVVLLDGFIGGVNTTGFASGDKIYVAVGGGYTKTEPTGSALIQFLGNVEKGNSTNGSGVIQMMGEARRLPNIQEGYLWIGNGDGVATTYSTSSLNFALTDINNTFTGTQNFTNISVSGTGSFAYLESITGSAKIIGDAFIVLNNNTPTERYAGVAVYDSGSAGVTASFQFDGLNNDWFYEYSDDGGVTTDHGVALFGPEYSVKGTPTYPTTGRLQKGTGGHHLADSNIADNGTIIGLLSETTIAGNLNMNAGGQVINIPNGLVEANEVAATTILGDVIEPNSGTSVTFNTDIVISGSVSNKVTSQGITSLTASIDFSDTSLFELTLGSGVDTHIDATNIGKGQTVNILITQNGTSAGTVSFSPKFLQPSGSAYTPTTTLNGQDILTLITYSDTSKIYVANVNKFI